MPLIEARQGPWEYCPVVASAGASPSGRKFILHGLPGVARAKGGRALPPATIELLPRGEKDNTELKAVSEPLLPPVSSVTNHHGAQRTGQTAPLPLFAATCAPVWRGGRGSLGCHLGLGPARLAQEMHRLNEIEADANRIQVV